MMSEVEKGFIMGLELTELWDLSKDSVWLLLLLAWVLK